MRADSRRAPFPKLPLGAQPLSRPRDMRALHLHAPSAALRRAALRRPAPRAACSQPAQRLAPHAPLARRQRRVCRAGEGESGGAEHLAVAAEEAVDDGEFWAKDLTDKVLVPDPEEEARAVAAAARSAALTCATLLPPQELAAARERRNARDFSPLLALLALVRAPRALLQRKAHASRPWRPLPRSLMQPPACCCFRACPSCPTCSASRASRRSSSSSRCWWRSWA